MVPSQRPDTENGSEEISTRKPLPVLLFAVGMAGALYDSFSGTCKLNIARSKYESAPKETTILVEESKGISDVTVSGTDGSGKPVAIHIAHPTDGGAVKFLEGAPTDGSTESVKQVSANTRHITIMPSGKAVSAEQITPSADGQMMQIVTKGTSPSREPFTDVEVYEKQ